MKKVIKKSLLSTLLVGTYAAAQTQPPLTVPVVNAACQDGPKMVGGKPEVVEIPAEDGFFHIFNGTDLTGWWENCATHTTDTRVGGVWIVDPSSKILYSREEGPNGDILVTNGTFDHYEIILDLWPTYGNDAGVFNRVTPTGKNWQTTVDYIQGSGVGGSFNEKGWAPTNINEDPFKFGAAGENAPEITTWTTFTKPLNPTSFGCSANGCTTADFPNVWNTKGWNQLRIKFYGGLTAADPVVKMETWMRKVATPEVPWVPVYKAERSVPTPAGPIALQIHGGGRWKAGTYNLYRNIKVRRLKADGTPVITTIGKGPSGSFIAPALSVEAGHLVGKLDGRSSITLFDVKGNVVENIPSAEGQLRHALPARFSGVFFAELKSDRGVSRVRLSRI